MPFERLGDEYDLMPGTVTIDCADAAGLAAWWAALLGVETHEVGPGYVAVRRQEGACVNLGFQEVPEPKQGKNRVHVDFAVRDLDDVTAKVVAAGGALVADHEYGSYRWRVVADPEGNEFCLVLVT